MPIVRVVCAITVALIGQLAISTRAVACDCAAPAATCAAFGQAAAVFSGRVVSIDDDHRVEFAVLEAFSGVTTPTVRLGEKSLSRRSNQAMDAAKADRSSQVMNAAKAGRFSNCDITFKAGETYLVYAYKSPSGALTTNICSRTRLLSSAQEDVVYARRIATLEPGTRGKIDGSVAVAHVERRGRNYQYSSRPLAHTPVTLEREGGRYYAVTNSKGEFSISAVPMGAYEARPVVPETYASPSPQTVRVWDPLGCGLLNFVVEYDGRIAGRLARSDGTAASGLVVSLAPTSSATMERDDMWVEAWSDDDGRFELRRAQPGSYLLRVDTTPDEAGGFVFYRGTLQATPDATEGTVLKVDRGNKIDVKQIVVPETPALLVMTAIIVDVDGRPVERAEVRLRDSWEVGPVYRTDRSGRFTFAVVEGRRYTLHAKKSNRDAGDRATGLQIAHITFKAERSSGPLKVTVRPPSGVK